MIPPIESKIIFLVIRDLFKPIALYLIILTFNPRKTDFNFIKLFGVFFKNKPLEILITMRGYLVDIENRQNIFISSPYNNDVISC